MNIFLKTIFVVIIAVGGIFSLTAVGAALVKPAYAVDKVTIIEQSDARLAEAKSFINTLTDQAVGFLENPSLNQEQRRSSFEKLLLDRFDMNTIARFSLGRYWRQASAEQKREYLSLFEAMVVEIYSQRFDDYKGQVIEIRRSRPEGTKDIVVSSYLLQSNGSEIQLDWRVRYKNGRYYVIDVVVEGVSMALTHRSEFSSVIQRGGGSVRVLLAHLNEQQE